MIENTSARDESVLVETMTVLVEVRTTELQEWKPATADCVLDPEPPVEVASELEVSYRCDLEEDIPVGYSFRVIAEATLLGSNEVFRLVGIAS